MAPAGSTTRYMGKELPPQPPTQAKPRKAKVKAPHFNDRTSLDDLTEMAEGIMLGDTNETISAKVAKTPSAVSQKFKDFKEVELPLYFPETVDEWRNDVIKFMQIALWKGVRRMANSIETIDERGVPVAVGIISDKLNGYMGNPTSVSVIQHQVINHADIMERLKQAKEKPIEA